MQGAGRISGPGGSFFTSWKEPVDYFLIEPFIPGSAFFSSGSMPGRFRGPFGKQVFCFRETVFLLPGGSRSITSLLTPSFREIRFFVPGTLREAVFSFREQSGNGPGVFCEWGGGQGRSQGGGRLTEANGRQVVVFWWRKDVTCCNIHFHFPS